MKKRRDFGRRELLAVDLGLDQRGGQVVTRIDAAILGERAGVCTDVQRHLHELVVVRSDVGVAEAENHVGPVKDALMVILGDAHHVADHLQRQEARQLRDHLTLAVRMLGDHLLDVAAGALSDGRLSAGHHLGGERPADDVAQP